MPARHLIFPVLLLVGSIAVGCHPNQPAAVSSKSGSLDKARITAVPAPSAQQVEKPTISDPPSSTADSLAQRANTYAQNLQPLLNQREVKANSPAPAISDATGDVQWIDPKTSTEVHAKPVPTTEPSGPAANVAIAVNEPEPPAQPPAHAAAPVSDPAPSRQPQPPIANPAVPTAAPVDASADALGAKLAQRVKDYPQDISSQLDYQLFQFLKGDSVPNLQTLAPLPGEDREMLSALLDGLSNFRSSLRADNNMLLSKKIRPILDLSDRLRTQAELSIPTVALCSQVVTYGVYTPIEPARFVAGFNDQICAYCEVENFASQLDANKQWETRLKMDVVIYSDQGLELWSANKSEKNSSGLVVDRSRNRRHDFFVIQHFRLPKTLVIGRYIIKVTVVDQEVNRIAENSLPLEIVAQ